MIWQLQMQRTLSILHFGEQLFTAVCSAKHAHYLLGVGNKIGESSKWKNMVLIKIKDMASKKFWSKSLEHWRSISSICSCNDILHNQHQKVLWTSLSYLSSLVDKLSMITYLLLIRVVDELQYFRDRDLNTTKTISLTFEDL